VLAAICFSASMILGGYVVVAGDRGGVFGLFCGLVFLLGTWRTWQAQWVKSQPPSEHPEWKMRIGKGQQGKAERTAVYDVLRRHGVVHPAASTTARAFHSGNQGEVALRNPQTARAVVAEFQALGIVAEIVAEIVEPQGSQEAAAGV
jgi:hypothetical protein